MRATVLVAVATCSLAALPTSSAAAAEPSPISTIESGRVQELLNQIGIGSLGTEEVVKALEGLPQLGGLEGVVVTEALTKAIESLHAEGANLGELLGSPLGAEQLETSLKEALGPLAFLLETLLKGNPATKLTEALGSVTSNELVGEVLGSSPEPEKELEEALGSIEPTKVEETLGTLPTGEGFTKKTVGELAAESGRTSEQLAEEFGQTGEELPESAMALTSAVANGKQLGVVKSLSGLGMALLGSAQGTGEEVEGLGGGNGNGNGGSGSGGNGGAGAPGNTTVVIMTPVGSQPPVGKAATAKKTVKILSHHVHGHTLTVVLSAPSAGTVTLTGHGIKTVHKKVAKAGQVTLKTTLGKAAAASMRHRHHRLNVPVKVTFKPASGSSSAATAKASFR